MSQSSGYSRTLRKTLVAVFLPVVLLGSLLTASPAAALGTSLTVTQLEWSLAGLDSNDVTTGPNQYVTGATVCNTTGVAVAGVTATWVWDQANAYVNLDSPALKTVGTLAANSCTKLWWTTEITRNVLAWNTSRDFHIAASAPTETVVQTTAGREIYVDKIQSQARNGVRALTGPTTVYVGDTVTYVMQGFTATGGYTTLEAGPIVDGTILDVLSVSATYVQPTSPTNRNTYFADGCAWNADPASGGYRTCSLANNAQTNYGGDPITVTVTAKVIAPGSGRVTALILDNSGGSSHYNSGATFVTVTAIAPAAPVAGDDSAQVVVGSSVVIPVPSNDTDADGDLALTSVSITTAPSHGSTSVNATTGVVTYTPSSPSYVGTDSFNYRICDSGGRCDTATVTVTIVAGPNALNDSASVVNGSSVPITVASNDSDPDGDLALSSVTITAAPSNGSTSVNGTTGVVTYTPTSPTFVGNDSFTYRICDSGNRCDTATVTVTITARPVAEDDVASTLVDSAVDIDVVVNDSDLDDDLDVSSLNISTYPANGSIVDVDIVNGVVTYEPDLGFEGTDTFVYEICDTEGLCDTATVSVIVTSMTGPHAIDDTAAGFANADLVVDVASNDTDPDNNLDVTTVTIITNPNNGAVSSVDEVTGEVTYTPEFNFVGSDSFEYEICDGYDQCDIALVTLTITAPPVAVDDSGATLSEVPVTVDVPANDTDLDDDLDVTTVSIVSMPGHGSVVIDPATGEIEYTSVAGFAGIDTFSYRICDSENNCAVADVSVTVSAPPAAPIAGDDSVVGTTAVPVLINVPLNDSDDDGDLDVSSVHVTIAAGDGSTSVDRATGKITYTSAPGFVGADTFTYEICDLQPVCDQALVSVTISATPPRRLPPVASNDSAATESGVGVVVNVPLNDFDADGDLDVSSVSITVPASSGSTSVNSSTGRVTYTPSASFVGTDTFTYRICDSQPACDTATVTVTVTAAFIAPAPPVANDNNVTTKFGTPITIDVLANDSDQNGDLDPASVGIVTAPRHGTAIIDPVTFEIVYTPASDFRGVDSFSYQVCDSREVCTTATVTIEVLLLESLAFTGMEPGKPLLMAIAALLLGGMATILMSRRRRESRG